MKQVLLSGKGEIEVFDVPVPASITNSVLVKNVFSLISTGTEGGSVSSRGGMLGVVEKAMHSHDRVLQVWNMVKTQGLTTTVDAVNRKLSDYVALGYSCAGQVVEVSSDDTPFRPGDFVACMGGDFATHAEYVVVPSNLVAKIPEGVGFEEAAFGALASIAMQGIRRLELTPGEKVGVLGLGLIGQISVQLLSAMGYVPLGMDLLAERAAFAKESTEMEAWGIEEVDSVARTLTVTNGIGLDGVIVCASTKNDEPINMAFDLCRKGGRVSLVGDVGLKLTRAKMYQKELELRISCSYGPGRYDPSYEIQGRDYPLRYARWTEKRNLEYFLELCSKQRIDMRRLVTAKYPVGQAVEAYARIKTGGHDTFGVLISYGDLPERVSPPPREAFRIGAVQSSARGTDGRVRLGIIGCGSFMSNVHFPNLGKLSSLYDLRGVASRSGSSSAVAARKYNIPFSTTDHRYLLDDPAIDAVLVSTRHSSHGRLVLDAVNAGKHVFVEKPMCITVEEGERIAALAREKGVVIRVGFNRRFAPLINEMKNAVGNGGACMFSCRVNIGSIANDWSNTAEEGGRLLGEGVHFFDLCNWFIDQPVLSVSSVIAGERKNTNPNVMVQIQYADGGLAQVLYTSLGNPQAGKEYFEAHGNGRSVIMDDYRSIKVFGGKSPSGKSGRGDKGHFAELEEFAAAIQGRPSHVQGADAGAGLLATEIALSVYADLKKEANR